jgi:hypothetical protein
MSASGGVSRCDQAQVALRLKVFPGIEAIDATRRGVLVATLETI